MKPKKIKEMSAIVNSKTGKIMTRRGLRAWWKKPITYKDLMGK